MFLTGIKKAQASRIRLLKDELTATGTKNAF